MVVVNETEVPGKRSVRRDVHQVHIRLRYYLIFELPSLIVMLNKANGKELDEFTCLSAIQSRLQNHFQRRELLKLRWQLNKCSPLEPPANTRDVSRRGKPKDPVVVVIEKHEKWCRDPAQMPMFNSRSFANISGIRQ